jgi:predicted metal-dependent hydrolase
MRLFSWQRPHSRERLESKLVATGAAVPFKYRVRVNRNARSVRLRITSQRGLEVTVPRRFAASRISALLERERSWIREALERVEARRQLLEITDPWRLPAAITLPALGASWSVGLRPSKTRNATVRELDSQRLLILGATHDDGACRKALARWLIRKARLHLVPALHATSVTLGVRYRRAAIRRQRTRWASCSSHGTISLSANLMFLPPGIVDYVLMHELCHLREMNHSKRFWRLVELHSPDYRKLDAELRRLRKAIPRWAQERG